MSGAHLGGQAFGGLWTSNCSTSFLEIWLSLVHTTACYDKVFRAWANPQVDCGYLDPSPLLASRELNNSHLKQSAWQYGGPKRNPTSSNIWKRKPNKTQLPHGQSAGTGCHATHWHTRPPSPGHQMDNHTPHSPLKRNQLSSLVQCHAHYTD